MDTLFCKNFVHLKPMNLIWISHQIQMHLSMNGSFAASRSILKRPDHSSPGTKLSTHYYTIILWMNYGETRYKECQVISVLWSPNGDYLIVIVVDYASHLTTVQHPSSPSAPASPFPQKGKAIWTPPEALKKLVEAVTAVAGESWCPSEIGADRCPRCVFLIHRCKKLKWLGCIRNSIEQPFNTNHPFLLGIFPSFVLCFFDHPQGLMRQWGFTPAPTIIPPCDRCSAFF